MCTQENTSTGFVSYKKYDGLKHHEGLPVVTAKPQYIVASKKLGEYASYLHPEFSHNAESKNKRLSIEIPEVITSIARDISAIGGRALLVGGMVRDALRAEAGTTVTPKDFDLEIFGLSYATVYRLLLTKFSADRIETVGRAFGAIKIRVDELSDFIDVSIPRRESKVGIGYKGFHIQGDPSMKVHEAASRRDLTINSASYDPLSHILHDPFGAELDLEHNAIKITNPEAFIEDPLRVLRVMQFISRFEMNPTPETIEICKKLVATGELDSLPRERITVEFEKLLLKSKRPSLGLRFAMEVGVIERLFPELFALYGVPQHSEKHPEGHVWEHILQTIDAARSIAEREGLNPTQTLILLLTLLNHDNGKPETTVFYNGEWHAPKHEVAGVEPTRKFFLKFIFSEKIMKEVLALIPEHLNPVTLYSNEFPDDDRKPVSMNSALNSLAVRITTTGSSMYMLSLVVEADQRGRNGTDSKPLELEDLPKLVAWKKWFTEKMQLLSVEKTVPKKIVSGEHLLNHFGAKKGGEWLGCLVEAVYRDQLDDRFSTLEEGTNIVEEYVQIWYEKTGDTIETIYKAKPYEPWKNFRSLDDPRELFR